MEEKYLYEYQERLNSSDLCVLSLCMCMHVYVCSAFRSYLAHKGLRGRSSARLESWWPHTRTFLGLFPRCFQSVMLLQEKEKQRKMFSRVCNKCSSLPLHPLLFIQRYLSIGLFLFLLHSDPAVSSPTLLQHPIKSALLLFL